MKTIKHYAMIYWSKKALKYDNMLEMYKRIGGIDNIYVTGLMVVSRDACIEMVKRLDNIKPLPN